ncbi:MAG: glycosyltransferase family 2 protein [Pseudomonadota bacterium]
MQAHPEGHADRLRVVWPREPSKPLVSILIATRDRVDLLRACLESIATRTDYANVEILVADNGSEQPETRHYLETWSRETPHSQVLRLDGPFNFSALNNALAEKARGGFLVMMNNDIEVLSPDWIEEMMSLCRRPDIGAVGARLWYPNHTIQHAGTGLESGGPAHRFVGLARHETDSDGRAVLLHRPLAVTAAVLMVRASAWEAVQGMDPGFAVDYGDVDFCLRLNAAGFATLYTPFAEFLHHESASRGLNDSPQKKLRFAKDQTLFVQRWPAGRMDDPSGSPNADLCFAQSRFVFPRTDVPARIAKPIERADTPAGERPSA